MASIGLGTWGTLANGAGAGGGRVVDAMLQSVSYLTLNGLEPLEGGQTAVGDWLVRASRVCALLFFVLGIALVVDTLASYWTSLRFRWRARGWFGPRALHLICGLGWHGSNFVNNAEAGVNRRTLAIDGDPSEQARADCERHGVPLLVADAGRDDVLARLDFRRIARVFVATGSDRANLRVVFRLAERVAPPRAGAQRSPRLVCMVHLAEVASHEALLGALPSSRHGLDIRIFNHRAVTVRELYRRHWLDRFPVPAAAEDPDSQPDRIRGGHLVLFGSGGMADELLLQALQLNVYEPSKSFRVDVLDPSGAQAASRWRARHPCFAHGHAPGPSCTELAPDAVWERERVLPRIRFHDLPASVRGQVEWCEAHCRRDGWVTTVVVALDDPGEAVALALGIAETLRSASTAGDAELWVYVNAGGPDLVEDVRRVLAGAEAHEPGRDRLRIRVFNDYLGDCRRDLVTAACIEDAAKRVNQVFNLHRRNAETTERAFLEDRDSIDAHWFPLGEDDRDSSRQAASHAWVKDRIGKRLRAAQECAAHDTPPEFGEFVGGDPVRLMATVEHRRWCAQQLLAGMRPLLGRGAPKDIDAWDPDDRARAEAWFGTPGAKDAWRRRKYHADLLPFTELAGFDALAAGAGLGRQEQEKDVGISGRTRYIMGQDPMTAGEA